MDLKTFFENFDEIAQAPGGVKRLRELILDLAVRGKLVEQDQDDEPANQLLVAIKSEQASASKKLRKPKKLTPIDEVDKPFDLPFGWCWARFTEVGELARGRSKHRPRNAPELYSGGNIPLVQTGDVAQANGYVKTHTALYNEVGLAQSRLWKAGTLCITIAANIADSAILKFDACFPDSVVGFQPTQPITDARYFDFFIRTLKSSLEDFAPSTAQKNINLAILDEVLIPLPPLAEQKRIVAKVDELMALCDEVEAAQQSRDSLQQKLRASALDALMNAPTDEALSSAWAFVSEHWDELCQRSEDVEGLRQAVLQMGIRGKLESDSSSKDTTSELLKELRIRKEELIRSKQINKGKPIEDIGNEIPYEISSTWSWVRLGEIVQSIKYGTSKKSAYQVLGTPVLRIPNIETETGKVTTSDLKFSDLSEKEIQDLSLLDGDLLMIRSNGSKNLVGRTAVVDSRIAGHAYAGYLVRLRTFPDIIDSYYIHLALSTSSVRDQIEVPIRTTSGVKNINTSEISNLLFPLPPLAEQKRIVAKVEQLMTLCDSLQTHLQQRQQTAQALAQRLTQLTP